MKLDGDGVLWAGETVRPSQNCTIRLIVLKDDGSAAARQSVLEVFHRLGTTGEGIERYRMVALDVPRGGGTGRRGVSSPPGTLQQSDENRLLSLVGWRPAIRRCST
ncbi:DUF4265 domain-containing protein [Streptomyces sp. NBC_00435]|uniref:DUF4265 domain-containing protein n=1 Tax=Streptomyces sp. NBC_00435 TaxID=2903649 RepID=UPI002E1F33D0